MNFVKLTWFTDRRPTYINLDRVCEIFPDSGGGAMIVYHDETTHVMETPEQIINYIKTGKMEA